MLTSILANAIVPIVLNFKGYIFLVFSIVPLEALVLWLFFNKAIAVKISIPRALLISTIANITSSLFGFISLVIMPTLFWLIYTNWFFTIFIGGFIISIAIERQLYYSYFTDKFYIPQNYILLKAAFWVNLVSYVYLFIAIASTTSSISQIGTSKNLLFHTRPSFAHQKARSFSYNIINSQMAFYRIHSQFSPTLRKLNEELDILQGSQHNLLDNNRVDAELYQYEMFAEMSRAVLISFPKQTAFSSFIYSVFVDVNGEKTEFIQGRCRSDLPAITSTETPILVDGKIQCPPNFSGGRLR